MLLPNRAWQYIRFIDAWYARCKDRLMHCLEDVLRGHGGHHVTVLVVEDEDVSRRALANLLRMSGYLAQSVATAESALELLNGGPEPAIALVDLDLPGMNGAELILRLHQSHPAVRTILVTAADTDRVNKLLQRNARDVHHIRKPIDFNSLLHVLDSGQES
jgi:CheY-like chemotaxis protein